MAEPKSRPHDVDRHAHYGQKFGLCGHTPARAPFALMNARPLPILAPNTFVFLPLYLKPKSSIPGVAKPCHNHKQRIIETLT